MTGIFIQRMRTVSRIRHRQSASVQRMPLGAVAAAVVYKGNPSCTAALADHLIMLRPAGIRALIGEEREIVQPGNPALLIPFITDPGNAVRILGKTVVGIGAVVNLTGKASVIVEEQIADDIAFEIRFPSVHGGAVGRKRRRRGKCRPCIPFRVPNQIGGILVYIMQLGGQMTVFIILFDAGEPLPRILIFRF